MAVASSSRTVIHISCKDAVGMVSRCTTTTEVTITSVTTHRITSTVTVVYTGLGFVDSLLGERRKWSKGRRAIVTLAVKPRRILVAELGTIKLVITAMRRSACL